MALRLAAFRLSAVLIVALGLARSSQARWHGPPASDAAPARAEVPSEASPGASASAPIRLVTVQAPGLESGLLDLRSEIEGPEALGAMPGEEGRSTPGIPSLTPEDIRIATDEVERKAESIEDPLQRSQALERMVLTKIRLRELDDAHRLLLRAVGSAQNAPMGLRRDLRYIELVNAIRTISAAQIIEAVSSSTNRQEDGAVEVPAPLEDDPLDRLELARQELRLGFELCRGLEKVNYQCELTSRVAQAAANCSQLISRSGLRESLLPFSSDIPRLKLLERADELLQDAAVEASGIPRAVWRDRALVDVATTAAEALQFTRARLISQSIPGPSARAEALTRSAESLIRIADRIVDDYPGALDAAMEKWFDDLTSARLALQTNQAPNAASDLMALGREQEILRELLGSTQELTRLIDLMNQVLHSGRMAPPASGETALSSYPIQSISDLEAAVQSTLPKLIAIRDQLRSQDIGEQRPLSPPAVADAAKESEYEAIRETLPDPASPEMVELAVDVRELGQVARRFARQGMLPEATEIYNRAARAVASVGSADPKNDMAEVLIDSLISMDRFEDARAAVRLVSGSSQQLEALGKVAEYQGRRGHVGKAYAWIDSEIQPQYRPRLYRQVEQGALSAVDENRFRVTPSFP